MIWFGNIAWHWVNRQDMTYCCPLGDDRVWAEVTTMYCKNKSNLTRELRHKLESELEKNIMVRDNQSEENDNLNKVIHNIEIKLVKIYDQKAKGAQIRCREKWVEYGENNNSYF